MWPTAISQSIGRGNCLPCSARAVLADFGNGDHASENTLGRSRQSLRELLLRSAFYLDSWRKIAISLIENRPVLSVEHLRAPVPSSSLCKRIKQISRRKQRETKNGTS